MESPPDPMADLEAFMALANGVEGVEITHLVMSLPAATAMTVLASYAPLPFRRPPSKRADRRLRGRMIEAIRRA